MKKYLLWFALTVPVSVGATTPLIRFPSLAQDAVVFVARGELWRSPIDGGAAVKLAGGPGQVLFPHVSPDGRSVAFTWRKGGMNDVYVVPTAGGASSRITHGPSLSPYDNAVTGWTNTGDILFVAQRQLYLSGEFDTYSVPVSGGLAVGLGLEHSGTSSMAPDGHTLTYDTSFRNFIGDRWKRYRGGQASQLASYDTESHAYRRVASSAGIDTFPMWWKGALYFLSDRGPEQRLNLWRQDAQGFTQVTHYDRFDMDAPSVGPGGIAWQVGGDVYVLRDPTREPRRITVAVPGSPPDVEKSPRDLLRLSDFAGQPNYAVDGSAQAAWVAAGGIIFRIDKTGSETVLTSTSGPASSYPSPSPDGQSLAFVADRQDEQRIMVMPAKGGTPEALARCGSGVLFRPRWLPDGTGLIVADSENRLWFVPRHGDKARLLATDPHQAVRDAAISPDSRYVAFSKVRSDPDRALHLVDLRTGVDQELGPSSDDDHDPVFSPDGRDLFFLSARHELPVRSDRDELNIAGLESTGLYTVPLHAGDDAFPHRAGTVSAKVIGSEQLLGGAVPVPLPNSATLTALATGKDHLYVHSEPLATIAGQLDGMKNEVISIDLKSGKTAVVGTDADTIQATSDGSGIAWATEKTVHVSVAGRTGDSAFTLDHAKPIKRPLAALAMQVLHQAWKYDRDLFWDRKLGGVDWDAMLTRYLPLAARAASHEDTLYVVGELQGELSSSHMFVSGGSDNDGEPQPRTSLLGVDLAVDTASGRYRITHIYRGDASRPRFRAPLGAPGVEVQEGDLLLAVNGKALRVPEDPYASFPSGDKPVALDVSRAPSGMPVRHIEVSPIRDEREIRRLDWIRRNVAYVADASSGKFGYLHLRDFHAKGTEDLMRQWNQQLGKEALIIDIRGNDGGSTSQWVLDLLLRQRAGGFVNRQGVTTGLPGGRGPRKLVVVTDEFSASDGDQFPYYFRKYGLGRVVGERTWGGVRGIQGRIPLADGTGVSIPKDSLVDDPAGFVLENRGSVPDIEVHARPAMASGGSDELLDAAIKALSE
ncbi:MAG: S41 family peptidase [Luteibacter sp.]